MTTDLYIMESRHIQVLERPGEPPEEKPLGYFLSEIMSGRLRLEPIAFADQTFEDPREDYFLLGVFVNCLVPSGQGGKRGEPSLLYARSWQNRDAILRAGAKWDTSSMARNLPKLAESLAMTQSEATRFIASIQEDLARAAPSPAGAAWLSLQRSLTEKTAPHVVALEIQRPLKSPEREALWIRWRNAGLSLERHDVPLYGYRAVHSNALLRAEVWWLIEHEIRITRCKHCGGPFVRSKGLRGRPPDYCHVHSGDYFRQQVHRGKNNSGGERHDGAETNDN